jgi:hypothetical protein
MDCSEISIPMRIRCSHSGGYEEFCLLGYTNNMVLRNVRRLSRNYLLFFFWFVRLLALPPLLAYCASLGWWWRWLWRSRWNVDWQREPKFSEKTCPSATFVHHKIPHYHARFWTQAAAVGSRRLTAWAMARPQLLTYVRSWALPKKLPIVQPFRDFPAL